jgi:hypothetical protein
MGWREDVPTRTHRKKAGGRRKRKNLRKVRVRRREIVTFEVKYQRRRMEKTINKFLSMVNKYVETKKMAVGNWIGACREQIRRRDQWG